MKTVVTKAIKFKDGTSWKEGTEVIIEVPRDNPSMALLTRTSDMQVRKIHSLNLSSYFEEFEPFGMSDVEEAMMDSVCPSLTGDSVEPDGWDSEGFPSILLASGLI